MVQACGGCNKNNKLNGPEEISTTQFRMLVGTKMKNNTDHKSKNLIVEDFRNIFQENRDKI